MPDQPDTVITTGIEESKPDAARAQAASDASPKKSAGNTRITIRNTLFAVVGVFLVMTAALAGFKAVEAVRDLDIVGQADAANAISDLLLNSANNWAVERGVTNAALVGNEPIGADVREKIDARRATADPAFAEALKRLAETGDFGGKQELMTEATAAFEAAKAKREFADAELAKPKANRDMSNLGDWVPAMTALILRSQELRVAITASVEMDGATGQLVSLKHFAWLMSEFAGRERAILGGMISSNARLTSDRLRLLSRFRGEVEAGWNTLTGQAGSDQVPDRVKQAVAEAKTAYFTEFQNTRESVYAAGTDTARYPMTTPQWISEATAGIDSVLAVRVAVSSAWDAYGVSSDANAISDNLIVAAGNWAVERGATNSALNAEGPVTEKLRGVIDQRRAKADAAFETARGLVAAGRHFENKQSLMNDLEQAHAKANSLRREADAALKVAKDQRDANVLESWLPTVTARILKSQALRLAATRAAGRADPRINDFLSLKHAAWVMAEYAGRERAILGGTIGANAPLSPANRTRLATFRGRVEGAWDDAQAATAGADTPAEVTAAMAGVDKVFFGDYQTVRDAVYGAALGTAAYPMTTGQWIETSTTAIDTLLGVQSSATQGAQARLSELSDAATWNLIVSVAVLIAALALGGAAVWVVAFRVAKPMAFMTDAMGVLAGGNLEIDIPGTERADEIGEMAAAVQVFKDNAIEGERLRAEAEEAAEQDRQREEEERQRKEREAEAERQRETERLEAERRLEQEERERQEKEAEQERELRDKEAERQRQIEQAIGDFEGNVKGVVEAVSSASTQMEATSTTMAGSAEETSGQAAAVAAASEQAATNVQT
ncbi:MAG: HAMP domain-containing protein, partial [Alphaproteobacteria bacterium]|nr:HAMP domain-containing protein [Alphaproteobacteria bacterium]MDP6515168.1 HAMP domain-containing protein [Alphaproteobacteria bacterium]